MTACTLPRQTRTHALPNLTKVGDLERLHQHRGNRVCVCVCCAGTSCENNAPKKPDDFIQIQYGRMEWSTPSIARFELLFPTVTGDFRSLSTESPGRPTARASEPADVMIIEVHLRFIRPVSASKHPRVRVIPLIQVLLFSRFFEKFDGPLWTQPTPVLAIICGTSPFFFYDDTLAQPTEQLALHCHRRRPPGRACMHACMRADEGGFVLRSRSQEKRLLFVAHDPSGRWCPSSVAKGCYSYLVHGDTVDNRKGRKGKPDEEKLTAAGSFLLLLLPRAAEIGLCLSDARFVGAFACVCVRVSYHMHALLLCTKIYNEVLRITVVMIR